MDLRHSYTLFAPVYDLFLSRASAPLRRASLSGLNTAGKRVLIAGVGSGLDLPHLPKGAHYVGIDLTPAMLKRARPRARQRGDVTLHQGNVMQLPYPDESFDAVLMHLILAVVPEPQRALREAERVLKPGGQLLILDKFLRPGERAPLRRFLNVASRRIATRMDVVFEEVMACCQSLRVEEDEPLLARGWFRRIHVKKIGPIAK